MDYPKKAQIEITTACNLNCKGCLKPKTEAQVMDITTYQKALTFLKEFGIEEVHLHNWGEPLLHDDIIPFVRWANEIELKVGFTTNGLLLTYDKLINLADAGLDILDISWKLFYTAKQKHDIGFKYRVANGIGLDCSFRCVAFSDREAFKLKRETLVFNKVKMQRGMIERTDKIRDFPCQAIRHNIMVMVNGDIVPCCAMSKSEEVLGNIKTAKIDIVKMKIDFLGERINKQMIERCKRCFEVELTGDVMNKL